MPARLGSEPVFCSGRVLGQQSDRAGERCERGWAGGCRGVPAVSSDDVSRGQTGLSVSATVPDRGPRTGAARERTHDITDGRRSDAPPQMWVTVASGRQTIVKRHCSHYNK